MQKKKKEKKGEKMNFILYFNFKWHGKHGEKKEQTGTTNKYPCLV